MRKMLGKVTPTVAAVAVSSALAVGGGTAYAAHLIQTKDIANNAVTSSKIADGNVKEDDLSTYVQKQLAKAGTAGKDGVDGTNGTNGKDGKDGKDADPAITDHLQDEIDSLQAQVTDLQSEGWMADAGTLGHKGGLQVIESADDTAGAGASKNTRIQYKEGDTITVTGTLSDGAQAGNGAPRAFIIINGVVFTSVDNVNPDYGTSADGSTFTQTLVPVAYDGTTAPSGVISQVGLAYDNTSAPGTATFTSLKIGTTNVPLA